MSVLAPRNIRKRYNATELIAQCDPNAELAEEMKALERIPFQQAIGY